MSVSLCVHPFVCPFDRQQQLPVASLLLSSGPGSSCAASATHHLSIYICHHPAALLLPCNMCCVNVGLTKEVQHTCCAGSVHTGVPAAEGGHSAGPTGAVKHRHRPVSIRPQSEGGAGGQWAWVARACQSRHYADCHRAIRQLRSHPCRLCLQGRATTVLSLSIT